MTDVEPPTGKTWLYQFSQPGDIEIETRDLNDDDSAKVYARELSKKQNQPIIIQRHDHVDWEYVIEVDERH